MFGVARRQLGKLDRSFAVELDATAGAAKSSLVKVALRNCEPVKTVLPSGS